MQLPYSEELNIGYLSKLFENTTNCYKFFWFQAILRKMDGVRSRFTFDELINEMIADAWYMVTEYHLRLGPLGITDNLEEVVKYIHEKYRFAPAEKQEKILEFLQEVEDKRIIKYKSDLTLNVPYRLQGRHVGREAEYSAHRTGYADQSVQCNHIYRDSIIILPALRKFRT